ncbi:Leo1-like protein [Corchorus olitorius]|uniref:Leo1-like protein n=1 Tax=Corchorus olitorius TaxID=93759 RepID=A0A1R3G0M6_9ROSI|nr:Leo1-like protein [Corchorus olitorius]
MGEEKRHQMMQNLFGDQSEEEEEVDSEHESNPHPNYASELYSLFFETWLDGSKSPGEEKDQTHLSQSAAEIRDVFGDSDDEEAAEYAVRHEIEQDENRSPLEEEGSYGKSPRPEDMVHDEDAHYESDDEHIEVKQKEKPVGPPLELEVPLRPAPARPTKMNVIKVSNIMGIDPKPFDPKTYVEEDTFVTDESGSQKRIRLENNIVRWRSVRKKDGTISGILQSQGRILRKMRFMPSSLTSNSHRLLTALVDSRHKKVYKVKNCVTDIDPEREKEEKEKAENQTIRANILLNRKREKVNRKYTQNSDRKRPQLSTGYLEGALDEDDEMDYNDSRRSRRRFDEELEVEARSEKRIMNAKKEPRKKVKQSVGSIKRKGIESDEDSPPRKAPAHRRMAVVYDSDEE